MADLKHYGVLGMRWGRRKGGGSVTVGPGVRGKLREVGGLVKDAIKDDLSKARSLASRFKSPPPDKDFAVSRELKKKPISKLSNAELKTVITRLQLEKQFKDLNPETVGRGKGIVSKLLQNIAGKFVSAYAKGKIDPDFVTAFEQARNKPRG